MSERRAKRAWCPTCERDVWLGPDDPPICPTCGGEVEVREDAGASAPPEQALLENEEIFRGINEQLRAQAGQLSKTELVEFVCECGRLDCDASVYLSDEEYSRVRAHRLRFFCLPGHELPAEAVIERHERYLVLEKSDGGERNAGAEPPQAGS